MNLIRRVISLHRTLFFISLWLFLLSHSFSWGKNIGLLVVATGKYIQFVPDLIKSAEQFFCKNHKITYFIFTDSLFPSSDEIKCIYHPRLGWPFDTMMRYHAYYKNQMVFEEQDYLYATDADMLFVDTVGDEILGERVATLHPGFVKMRGSYETAPRSNAYVNSKEGKYYFAGGFYGGSLTEFIKIAQTNSEKIDDDLERGIIAVWHDESHWNRYCIDNPPTVIISPSYCYPESWDLNYQKKLLALDKNHDEIRK